AIPPSSIIIPAKINNGTATIIKLFIELYIDCTTILIGTSVNNTIDKIDDIPNDAAMGIPNSINTKNTINRKTDISFTSSKLILYDKLMIVLYKVFQLHPKLENKYLLPILESLKLNFF